MNLGWIWGQDLRCPTGSYFSPIDHHDKWWKMGHGMIGQWHGISSKITSKNKRAQITTSLHARTELQVYQRETLIPRNPNYSSGHPNPVLNIQITNNLDKKKPSLNNTQRKEKTSLTRVCTFCPIAVH